MKQIKPEVIGYLQIMYKGNEIKGLSPVNKFGMQEAISFDMISSPGHKPKFRLVYKKEIQ